MIVASGIEKAFGKLAVLRGVNLQVRAGERVALVGPNGSGKTTLLRSIVGLLRYRGHISIGGVDVARDPVRALKHVAYVPQVTPPLDAPVGELLRAWGRLRGIDVARAAPFATALDLSLETIAKTRLRDLSGGMKQKLLLAVGLASEPHLLVCDEPTANLDPAARIAFFTAVAALPAETAMVICSHRLDEVRHLVGRVVELDEGAVIADRSVDDFVATQNDDIANLLQWRNA